MYLEKMSWRLDNWTCGVANQVTNAQVISSTAVSEMQKLVVIILIQLEVLDYAQ